MFTGIIEELGEVLAWERSGDSGRLTVRAPRAAGDARHGDSIAVDGVCLTVVDQGPDWFTADVMAASIAMSTLGERRVGDRVDIERAASLGDRLGGHIVQGHVDGTASVLAVRPGDGWRVLRFTLDPEHAPLVVRKGSIAVNGVSLTVSEAGADWFEVSLIPETLAATTLGALDPGDRVNLETDVLARHVQRLLGFDTRPPSAGATQPAEPDRGFDTRPAEPGATQPKGFDTRPAEPGATQPAAGATQPAGGTK